RATEPPARATAPGREPRQPGATRHDHAPERPARHHHAAPHAARHDGSSARHVGPPAVSVAPAAMAAPAWRQVEARVARQEDYGAGHSWLDLDVPASFERPLPGQFVQLLLGATAASTLLPRP